MGAGGLVDLAGAVVKAEGGAGKVVAGVHAHILGVPLGEGADEALVDHGAAGLVPAAIEVGEHPRGGQSLVLGDDEPRVRAAREYRREHVPAAHPHGGAAHEAEGDVGAEVRAEAAEGGGVEAEAPQPVEGDESAGRIG